MLILKAGSNYHVEGGKLIGIRMDDSLQLNGVLERYSLQNELLDRQVIENGFLGKSIKPVVHVNEIVSNSSIDDDELPTPPFLMMLYPTEPLPVRPYQLVEYMMIQSAYNNLVTTSRYYYYTQANKEIYYGGKVAVVELVIIPIRRPSLLILVWFYVTTDKYFNIMNCFNSIPDQGAVCSIELFTDIPVDANPRTLFDWLTNSPGHAFIRLSKSSRERQ